MSRTSNEKTPRPAYAGPRMMTPSRIAGSEASAGLGKLAALAHGGDSYALRIFHSIACTTVGILNDEHLEHAASVLEWPVLLPREREARTAVTTAANAMLIGSVRGGGKGAGKGAGEKLAYTSDKGFALKNLLRVSEARDLLRMARYDGRDDHTVGEIGANGFMTGWTADAEFMEIVFRGTVEIDASDPALLLAIRDLPDYCPETCPAWIDVMVRMLDANPDLIPDAIRSRKTTLRRIKGKTRIKHRGAKGVVRKLLTKVLDKVPAVPGIFGDFVGDK